MDSPLDERPRGRRRFRTLAAVFASTFLVAGASAAVFGPSTASAAPIPVSQCNGVYNTPGLTVSCRVTIVNTLTDDPTTTGSVITLTDHTGATTTVSSTDIVISVTQCNSSARGGGATLQCYVNITNNIAVNGAATATNASISQCNNNQAGDGLGNAPNTCSPVANSGSGATIYQCNDRTGDGGGIVTVVPDFSHCLASGSVSSSLPVRVNQCNTDSADGGGSRIDCRTTITTNVVDTSVTATGGGTPTGGGGGGTPTGGGGGGTPGSPVRPVTGVPNLTG